MPRAIFTNNARTTLAAGITNVATAITVADGSVFPSPSGGDWAYLTLEYGASMEIVKLTARSGNTLTVQRAQDGTSAAAFSEATVSLRITKVALDEIHTDIAAAALTAAWANVSGKPSTFTPSAHTHAIADVTGLQAALDGKAATSHTHAAADITSGTFDNARIAAANVTQHNAVIAPTWANVSGKPSTFTPSTHTHIIGDVTGLQTALDGKGNLTGTNSWVGVQAFNRNTGAAGSTVNVSITDSTYGARFVPRAGASNFNSGVGADDFLIYYTNGTQNTGAISIAPWSSEGNRTLRLTAAGAFTYGGNTVWHAGNDGSTSGLDADLLDGIQGSGFARNGGTTTADLNTIVTSGMWRLEGANANLPSGTAYGQLMVSRGSDTILQIASDYQGQHLYFRNGNSPDVGGSGAYSAWRSIWHTGNFDPATKANLNGAVFTGNVSSSTRIISPRFQIGTGSSDNASNYRDYTDVNTDITTLVTGTGAGSLIESPINGHAVVGIRGNDAGDSFSVISGNQTELWGTGGNTSYSRKMLVVRGDRHEFYTGGVERMRIDAAGNVGIGTATPTNGLLELRKDVSSNIGPVLALNNQVGGTGAGAVINFIGVGTQNVGSQIRSSDDGAWAHHLLFSTKATGASGNALVERMRITSAGNVGVGTTAPTSQLHVYTNADVWHTRIGGATGEIRFGGQTGSGAVIQSGTPAGAVRDLYLQRDGGNVGIGTTGPTHKLEVHGTHYWNGDGTWAGGTQRFYRSDAYGIGDATGGLGRLEVFNASTGAAFMTFHRSGNYAAYFGLDTDNQWKVGGWSAGAVAHVIWHKGNLQYITNQTNGIGFGDTGSRGRLLASGGGLELVNTDNSAISFKTSSVERARINDDATMNLNGERVMRVATGTAVNSGRVSFGTAAPGALAVGEMYLRHA